MKQLQMFVKVFSQLRYVVAALGTGFSLLTLILWYQNWSIVKTVLSLSESPMQLKFTFLVSLYGGIVTNYTVLSGVTTVLICFLFGIQLALLHFYIRRMQTKQRSVRGYHGAGVAGVLAGVLGIGCAACGSVIVTSIFGLFGASGVLLLLPLHGAEFGVLGVVLLGYSIRVLLTKVTNAPVCTV